MNYLSLITELNLLTCDSRYKDPTADVTTFKLLLLLLLLLMKMTIIIMRMAVKMMMMMKVTMLGITCTEQKTSHLS